MSAVPKDASTTALELIKEIPLFGSFPDHLIQELAAVCETVHFPANTQIIKQGQPNEYLYFLLNGAIGVYVDGGRVSRLQRKGDLIGEMSVISKQPAGATILAETEVSLLRINANVLLNMQGPERDTYLAMVYRVYASVLAEKLHATNQKAKHFEELTIQLTATQDELREMNQNLEKMVEERTRKLEQQNAELNAARVKSEELLNSKKHVFRKLSELHGQYFDPLKALLDQLRKERPEDPVIDNARRVLFDVQHLIKPLAEQHSSEEAILEKRVLLADSDKRQQVTAKLALGGTGVHLDIASTLEEGQAKIMESTYDLIVFDAPMLELGNLARERNPNVRTVLMTSDQIPTYLPELKKLSCIPNIVSRSDDRTFTVKNIVTTVTKILSRDLFGLEKYVSWGVDVQRKPIYSSQQREELLDGTDQYFQRLGIRSANRTRIRTVVEEMLMNAIYDAPTDAEGQPLYNHLPRTVDLFLKPTEQGILSYATDGMLIAVSVQDPFGSLKGETILKYLEHNYSGSAEDLNAKLNKGGAGRGLHQIVENSDLVVINVDPGKKTEVIALFNVDAKERANQVPSFHLFVKS